MSIIDNENDGNLLIQFFIVSLIYKDEILVNKPEDDFSFKPDTYHKAVGTILFNTEFIAN